MISFPLFSDLSIINHYIFFNLPNSLCVYYIVTILPHSTINSRHNFSCCQTYGYQPRSCFVIIQGIPIVSLLCWSPVSWTLCLLHFWLNSFYLYYLFYFWLNAVLVNHILCGFLRKDIWR